VDLTHESLIRHWKRLEQWAKEEARYKEIYLGLSSPHRPVWNDAMVREALDGATIFAPTNPGPTVTPRAVSPQRCKS